LVIEYRFVDDAAYSVSVATPGETLTMFAAIVCEAVEGAIEACPSFDVLIA
jgi:hypothetical protein